MGDLKVTRWRRYGRDRLYVATPGDQRIGWVDLVTGVRQLEDMTAAGAFHEAVAAFCDAHGLPSRLPGGCDPVLAPRPGPHASQGTPAQAAASTRNRAEASAKTSHVAVGAPSPSPSARPVSEPAPAWVDLALNVPGQAARAQADTELASMRERSRVGTFLARAFDVKTDERAWRVGAGGEETVGARLEKLRKHGWYVLHAVPVGDRGSDIDHVVIGAGGVWTLNTKTHPGKSVWVGKHQVRVDVHPTSYLRNSRYEADRASRLLTTACGFTVVVKAALVFLTGSLIPDVTIKQAPDDVAVLDRTDIPHAFRRAPRQLEDEQVTAVFEQARRSTTWLKL